MKRIVRLVALCIVVLAAGCASFDGEKVAPEKLYRTGSNIAQRDHSLPDSVQTKQVDTADPNMGLPMGGRTPRSFGTSQ